jgi:hypothetical protein
MAAMDADERRRRGAWETPPALVERVVARALDGLGPARLVVDPACGDGRFLAAVGGGARLVGVDVDADALATARAVVPHAELVHGDALAVPLPGGADLVVANPPFLSQLSAATSRRGASALGGGAYADTAALFVLRALSLVRPGGRVAMVLPASFLAARDAADVRAKVLAEAALTELWWAGAAVFDAAVDTCVVVLVQGAVQGDVRVWHGPSWNDGGLVDGADLRARPTWSHLLAGAAGVPGGIGATAGTLGALADTTAGFRDHYYGLAPFVHDGPRPGWPALVTSGLLDVGRCAWGERPARFHRRRLDAPVVDVDGLTRDGTARVAAWVAGRRRPKVLLATQTKVLEAAVDAAGDWVPSVPVVSVEPHDPADVWRVGAVLCSPSASAWAATTYLGAGLSPGAVKLSASQVLEVPLPARRWDAAADALRAGDVAGCARKMQAAYEADPAVLAWWERLSGR